MSQWILIGNPENRRVSMLVEALMKHKGQTPFIISYESLLLDPDPVSLIRRTVFETKSSIVNVKIESPGENFSVTKGLIAEGAFDDGRISSADAKMLAFDKGRFAYLSEWSAGYSKILSLIDFAFRSLQEKDAIEVRFVNIPKSILLMNDKLVCQNHLSDAGISIPKQIPFQRNFSQFIEYMRDEKCFSAFVKPRFGSSASGVMAVRVNPGGVRCVARTSLEIVRDKSEVKLYNSLKVREYRSQEDISQLYSAIDREGAYAEVWVPKPTINGKNFDLRVVVIDGKACHYVTRCSKSPMTNLHLGNERGNILDHPNGEDMLHRAKASAEEAAKALLEAKCFGADILVSRDNARIIELNSFGDLLPDIEFEGLSTYEYQVSRL